MADPIISPDGKWMWTGTEWISAPPAPQPRALSNVNLQDSRHFGDMKIEQNSPNASSSINLRDSFMGGDMDIGQNSTDASSTINLKERVMSGDISITQNNPREIAAAMIQALNHMGIGPRSDGKESHQEHGVELSAIPQSSENDDNKAGWDAYDLGNEAEDNQEAISHYRNAFNIFRDQHSRMGDDADRGMFASRVKMGYRAYADGDFNFARGQFEFALDHCRDMEMLPEWEAVLLHRIGEVKLDQGLLEEAETDFKQSISIFKTTDLAWSEYFWWRPFLHVADLNQQRGELEAAVAVLEEGLPIAAEIENSESSKEFHFRLGELQEETGNLWTAEAHFQASLAISRIRCDVDRELSCLTSLIRLYVEMAAHAREKIEFDND